MLLELPLELLAYIVLFCTDGVDVLALAHTCRATWWLRREYLRRVVRDALRVENGIPNRNPRSARRAFNFLCSSEILSELPPDGFIVGQLRQLTGCNDIGYYICARRMNFAALREAARILPNLMSDGRDLLPLIDNPDPAVLEYFGGALGGHRSASASHIVSAIRSGEDHLAILITVAPPTSLHTRMFMLRVGVDHTGFASDHIAVILRHLQPRFGDIVGLLYCLTDVALQVAVQHYGRLTGYQRAFLCSSIVRRLSLPHKAHEERTLRRVAAAFRVTRKVVWPLRNVPLPP